MVNINDQSDKERCSRETIWNEIDIYNNNDNKDDEEKNNNDDNSMNCDNKFINNTNNNGQWNKACMCTGPDVNGSWIPCNSATKLAFLNNFIIKFYILNIIIFYCKL